MPNRYFSRSERKAQVILALKIKADNGGQPEGTAYTIARLLDMAVSPNLYSILTDMVAERLLNVRDEEIENRCTRTFYILADYKKPQQEERTVNLRINGTMYQEKLI